MKTNEFRRILIIKLQHFGDVLLTTPLITSLKLNYPNVLIDILVYDGTDAMILKNDLVNNIYTIKRGAKKGVFAKFQTEKTLFKVLKKNDYDLVLTLSMQWRNAIYTKLLNPKMSIAFAHKKKNTWWKKCFSHTIKNDLYLKQHEVLNVLSILKPLNISKISTKVTMAYDNDDENKVNSLIEKKAFSEYIVIQPTARWAFKTWSTTSFADLIDKLLAKGENIVLTAGKSEQELLMVEEIINKCKNDKKTTALLTLAGALDITELAVVIKKAKLFIGVDSAPMHMAAALGTSCVVLFGPSNLKQWCPWDVEHSLIWAGDYISLPEVYDVDTDTKERYLNSIPVEDVFAKTLLYL